MRGHGKSNVYSSPWKPTMIIIFGKQGNEKWERNLPFTCDKRTPFRAALCLY
jgi:hypothetical protein